MSERNELDLANQRYSYLLTAGASADPNANISQEKYFEYRGAPCNWDIIFSYADGCITTGIGGALAIITAEVSGGARVPINVLASQTYVPLVGGIYSAFGNRVYVQFAADAGLVPLEITIMGIPLIDRAPIKSDTQACITTNTVPNLIPPFSVAIANDPPFQTFEILDIDMLVIQTISFQSQFDFVPLDPRGIFYRNSVAAGDLVTVFKRKGYIS